MDIIKVLFTSVLSVIALFVFTKIMGKRQMAQLSMFDYINGITIGSIAAELATSLEDDFWLPFTAMTVYAVSSILITFISTKSIKARRFFAGRSTILFEKGEFKKADMLRSQVDVSEFMTQCRIYGCFSLSQLETAILEPNGKISFLLKSEARPAQPSDFDISPPVEHIQPTVILDGNIMLGNLGSSGRDVSWLKKELIRLNCNLRDVLIGEIGNDNRLYVYLSNEVKERRDIFQ